MAKKIQMSKKLKTYDEEKLLQIQNQKRKKYGLQPLKRLNIEHFINYNNASETQTHPKQEDIGVMYQ